jgi:hypothetical protein
MFLGIILGTNLIMMVVSLIQAYECRKITTEYAESLWISISIAVIAQVWIVGLPILRLLQDNPEGVFLTKVGIIVTGCLSTLAIIFGPKLGYVMGDLDDDIQPQKVAGHKTFNEGASKNHESSETESHSEDDGLYDDRKSMDSFGRHLEPLGIRIIPASFIHSEQADKLQMEVDKAEKRNRTLQATLETLQEKMEQYIVARDPLGSRPVSSNPARRGPPGIRGHSIIAARPDPSVINRSSADVSAPFQK